MIAGYWKIVKGMVALPVAGEGRVADLMSKTQLLDVLRTEHANWEAALAEIEEDRMTLPILHAGWSVKDTIGHVAYYEQWLLGWLEAAARGQVTVASHRDLLDVDQRNAIIWMENKDRSLADVLEQARQVYERLYQLVTILPEEDLIVPNRYDRYIVPFWGEARPLWKCIAGDSYEHYREHTANIRRGLAADKSSIVHIPTPGNRGKQK